MTSSKIAAFFLACASISCQACPYLASRGNGRSVDDQPPVDHDELSFTHSLAKKKSDRAAATSSKHQARALRQDERRLQLFSGGIFQFLFRLFFGWLIDDTDDDDSSDDPPVVVTNVAEAIQSAASDIEDLLDDDDDMIAKFVRLSFHDCVGGCDGCVNLSNPENFGLDEPIEELEDIVDNYSAFLTRADVWVLAGLTASEFALDDDDDGGGIDFEMEFVGRTSCADTTGGPDRVLPSPHLDTAGVTDYFAQTFDFTARESTAILGAHTLGRAQQENSGFNGNGGWVNNRDRLDNAYYRDILDNSGTVDSDWEPELQDNSDFDEFPDQFLWRQPGDRQFMFNADLALAVDFTGHIDSVTGAVTCALEGGSFVNTFDTICPEASTLSIVNEYANSNQVWLQDFSSALKKMTTTGCDADVSCVAV